jgi:hypothetical protein
MRLPQLRRTPLKLTRRGYVRQLGSLVNGGSVQKFYLGFDPAIAAQRRQWIEAVYVENCRVSNSLLWTDTFLNLAKQLARLGSAVIVNEPLPYEISSFGPPDYSFVQRLRDVGVPVSVHGEPATATVRLAPDVTPTGKPAVTKLHQAIDKYRQDRIDNYAGSFQGSRTIARKIDKFYELEDCWLWQLDYVKIKAFVDNWRNRPVTAKGTRGSKIVAEGTIGEFYKFLNWADASHPAEFQCPNLASIDRTICRLPSDAEGNAIKDVFWTKDELHEVFKTARPLTQLIIGLGLNACSGAAELGRIKVKDVHFNQQHPHAKLIRYDGVHDWLITTRRKAYTHSEALLWSWVAELVKQQTEVCRANDWPYLFTEDGEPLYRDNAIYAELGLPLPNTTKPESRFIRRFTNAVDMALKQKRITKKRSLGKLRKTFSNFLTLENHADLASLALAHTTESDELLKHYANKPYARLFRETAKHAKEWQLPK